MRRLMMWIVAVVVTAGLVGCGAPAPETPPPAKKATTAAPAVK